MKCTICKKQEANSNLKLILQQTDDVTHDTVAHAEFVPAIEVCKDCLVDLVDRKLGEDLVKERPVSVKRAAKAKPKA